MIALKVKKVVLALLLGATLTFGSGIAFGIDTIPATYACGTTGANGGGGCS